MPPDAPLRSLTTFLLEEHELLRRGLDLFARYAGRVLASPSYDPRLARGFLRFFREFGDLRHHEEEERVLFPWLEAHGLSGRVGPLVVLRHEHELGRELRLALSLAADALVESPLERDGRERFHGLALRYVELTTAHMQKEEGVLFPLAERLARQQGGEIRCDREIPAKERGWVEQMEARAADWPAVALSSLGHGTAEGFDRLCDEALRSTPSGPSGTGP